MGCFSVWFCLFMLVWYFGLFVVSVGLVVDCLLVVLVVCGFLVLGVCFASVLLLVYLLVLPVG